MKIIVVGATGIIGAAVADALQAVGHQVLRASRTGSLVVDLDDPPTIEALFGSVQDVDAVVCCAASGQVMPLVGGPDDDFQAGITGKLFGQVALVRTALDHLTDGGSITLTSGQFEKPFEGGAFGAMVNAGLEAFVENAAIETPRGIRLNVVSPGAVAESLRDLDAQATALMGVEASGGTPVAQVAQAYVEAVQGTMHGQRIDP